LPLTDSARIAIHAVSSVAALLLLFLAARDIYRVKKWDSLVGTITNKRAAVSARGGGLYRYAVKYSVSNVAIEAESPRGLQKK
jgi:hypothetical protein